MTLAAIMQLASPALPVGGFAYSRGLETAVERGVVSDAEGARAWIEGLADEQLARLELPLVLRAHAALEEGDDATLARWAAFARASRETDELARESEQMGRALSRWAEGLGLGAAPHACWTVGYAWAAWRLGLGASDAAAAFAWSWLEASVAAAVKLVPLGQTEGARILHALAARLDALVDAARSVDDDDVGALAPSMAIASALHETQHTRLFRS